MFILTPRLWEHNKVPTLSSLLERDEIPGPKKEGFCLLGYGVCSKRLRGTGGGDGHSGMGDLLQAHLGAGPGEPHRREEVPQAVQQLVPLVSSVWPCTALGAKQELLGLPLAVSACLVSE